MFQSRKCLITSSQWGSLVCSSAQFLWCKYCHLGLFQATNVMSLTKYVSLVFMNQGEPAPTHCCINPSCHNSIKVLHGDPAGGAAGSGTMLLQPVLPLPLHSFLCFFPLYCGRLTSSALQAVEQRITIGNSFQSLISLLTRKQPDWSLASLSSNFQLPGEEAHWSSSGQVPSPGPISCDKGIGFRYTKIATEFPDAVTTGWWGRRSSQRKRKQGLSNQLLRYLNQQKIREINHGIVHVIFSCLLNYPRTH